MQRNVWSDVVSLQTRRLNNSTKYLLHALTTIISKKKMKSVVELSQVCSQIVLKCLHLERIGRLGILRSVNKFARSITKWTKACGKRLNLLISHIHFTSVYTKYCYVGNTWKQSRLGLVEDSDFAGDLEESKSTSGGTLRVLEVIHLFQKVGCVRNKLQFHRVQQNPKSSLWTLDWERRDSCSRFVGNDCYSFWKQDSDYRGDVQSIGTTRWNFLESDTRNSIWFLTRGNPSWWNRAIHCERGNASWQTRANPISILKNWHGFTVSSLETMKQNWNC